MVKTNGVLHTSIPYPSLKAISIIYKLYITICENTNQYFYIFYYIYVNILLYKKISADLHRPALEKTQKKI